MNNLWFTICWWWERMFGKTYLTKYSRMPALRAATIFGKKVFLLPNEEGELDYTPEERENLSVRCGKCGRYLSIGELYGHVRPGDALLNDKGKVEGRIWIVDRDLISPILVGCVGCLEVRQADVIGRWMARPEKPLEAAPYPEPFETLVEVEYIEVSEGDYAELAELMKEFAKS